MAISLREGMTASTAEILDHIRPRVARWWLPDAVIFLEQMPMTATGKIRKAALREMFKDHFVGSSQ